MSEFGYALGKAICRSIGFCTLRPVVLHPERFDELPGGVVLACSHLSHLEPAIVASLARRKIDWMSRVEFFRYHLIAALLDTLGAFPIDRARPSHHAIRTAIERVRRGRAVGIFPEGGVALGEASALCGGPIKAGACVIAQHARRPIVPVVVIGTEKLNHPYPWRPFRHARVWINFGRPIWPAVGEPRRRRRPARAIMAGELSMAFQSLHRELCATCGIPAPIVLQGTEAG
jgi:1-acyl-sn-glycerol-3-phosphate acyltransferase